MIVVEWLDRHGRHQETSNTEPAGVTCVTYYEIEDVA